MLQLYLSHSILVIVLMSILQDSAASSSPLDRKYNPGNHLKSTKSSTDDKTGRVHHTNVVEENPSLDVGPLIVVRVASGTVARLPCDTAPLYPNDSVTLVLWYNDDTSRPFLSYDGRQHSLARRSIANSSHQMDPYDRKKQWGPRDFSKRDNSLSLSLAGAHTKKLEETPQEHDLHRSKQFPKFISSTAKKMPLRKKRYSATHYKRQRRKLFFGSLDASDTGPIALRSSYLYTKMFENRRNCSELLSKNCDSRKTEQKDYLKVIPSLESSTNCISCASKASADLFTSRNLISHRKHHRRRDLKQVPPTYLPPKNSSSKHLRRLLRSFSSTISPSISAVTPPYSSYLPYSSVRWSETPNPRASRVTLAQNGETLLIGQVLKSDQTEYRCTVHYRKSPSVTHRLRLEVQKRLRGMLLLDDSGMVVGREIGPHSEGHRLSITCRTVFEGELKFLEWMIDGEILPSSWSMPRAKVVVSHLELELVPEYDQKYLTCRIITQSSGEKSHKSVSGSTKLKHKTNDYNNILHALEEDYEVQRSGRDAGSGTRKHPSMNVEDKESDDSDEIEIETESEKIFNIKQKHNNHFQSHRGTDEDAVESVFVEESSGMELKSINAFQKRDESHKLSHQRKHSHKNQVQFSLKSHRNDKTKHEFHKPAAHKPALKYKKHKVKNSWKWEATITDISVQINMFSIPQTELTVVEGDGVVGVQSGISVEVGEGGQVTLECRVTAKPPPYNITFMLNGQVVSSPHFDQYLNQVDTTKFKTSPRNSKSEHHKSSTNKWKEVKIAKEFTKVSTGSENDIRKTEKDTEDLKNSKLGQGGASLLVSPVRREAEGLYTCLASNTEGDGHSNAIMIRVRHAPYCQNPVHRRMIVARNASVTLFCPVEANPKVTSYTWIKIASGTSVEDQRPPFEYLGASLGNSASLMVTPSMFQGFMSEDSNVGEQEDHLEVTHLKNSPKNLGKGKQKNSAHKTLSSEKFLKPMTPSQFQMSGRQRRQSDDDVVGVVCYAKNSEGYSVKPCLFSMQVVDPPPSPRNCSVSVLSSTRLAVNCLEIPDKTINSNPTPLPGLGYVRSPHTTTLTTLEVWSSSGLLLVNLTSVHPSFDVKGLPPTSDLQLRLYASSPERLVSSPVLLHATTPKWTVAGAIPKESKTSQEVSGLRPSPSLNPSDRSESKYYPPVQRYPPPTEIPSLDQEHSKSPSFSTVSDPPSTMDPLDIFIVLGSLVLIIGTVVSLFFGAFLLIKRSRRSDSSSSSTRRSNAKYMRNDSVGMMPIDDRDTETPDRDDEEEEGMSKFEEKDGTTLSDNDTGDDDLTEEACHLTEDTHATGSDFSLLENSPNFNRNHFGLSRGSSIDIMRIGSSANVSTLPFRGSKNDILSAAVDSTFAAADEAGNFFSSQQELRNCPRVFNNIQPRGYSIMGTNPMWSTLPPPQTHKMVTFLVPSKESTSEDHSADTPPRQMML